MLCMYIVHAKYFHIWTVHVLTISEQNYTFPLQMNQKNCIVLIVHQNQVLDKSLNGI